MDSSVIRVDRVQIDEVSGEIRPPDAWWADARAWRNTALSEGSTHQANRDIYAHNDVRKALEQLFRDKCAYCEAPITGFDWPVEHYRPKGKVKENPKHGGYYWLAYDWNNLYSSCMHCNEHRNEKPRWGDDEPLGSGGKATQFPLFNEKVRAKDDDGLAAERPMLLDPCDESIDPENHLSYDPFGHIKPYRRSRRGEATIRICFLSRKRLRDRRREVIGWMIERLKMLRRARSQGNANAIRDLENLVGELIEAGHCYSGAARDVVRAPRRFGVR